MRTLRSLLVLALALVVYKPAQAATSVSSQSGCGIAVSSCPDPEDYHYWNTQCQVVCGVYSYPGGCGNVTGDPNFPEYVLWCYQPS